MNEISMDFDIYHKRRWPGRPMSLGSCAWLLMSSPGLQLLTIHRVAQWLDTKRIYDGKGKWLWDAFWIPIGLLRFLIKINSKSDIDNRCEIEGGISFSDQGYIFFGAKRTGAGTVIGTRVTVGMSYVTNRCPKIGRNVWIGSDCVVYGDINIGDGATLLPGTVLSKSIPSKVVMQGNPALLVLRNFDNSELREHQDIDAIQYVTMEGGDVQ
jgi:serine acetyltransferase